MAQPNVAREPSMEEILASIRRIIESNEPGQGVDFAADPSFSDEVGASSELHSPPAHVPPPANQAFGQRQAGERLSGLPQGVSAETQGEKSLSLADVAARVRAAADRNASMASAGSRRDEPTAPLGFAPQVQTTAPQPFYGDQTARPVRPTDNRPLLAQAATQPREEAQQRIQDSVERMVEAPVTNWNDVTLRVPEVSAVVAPASPVAQRASAVDVDEQVPMSIDGPEAGHSLSPISANLLSEMAEQEIARSFDELQSLFNVEATPNVEEMTRDMLRPMLQDWLEDNLPSIVERLVREEISRVVRGQKR